jgi:hypothetical protein
MSFCQTNETNRRWNSFYQANKELIEEIGLPGPTVDKWDRFADLLMHGIIDHHDGPIHFNLDELSAAKLSLFRLLVYRYFEAGFSDPGVHPAMVGGQRAFLKLIKRFPQAFTFSKQYQKEAEDAPTPASEEWWLDYAALPDRFWARLTLYDDGSAEVLDLDGEVHEFGSREEAAHWLLEDEFTPMDELIEDGELPSSTAPPVAASDAELALRMIENVSSDN